MKDVFSQLSLREKRLLYILLCFLILVGGWFFVVTPSIDSYRSTVAECNSTQSQLAALNTQLDEYLKAPDLLKMKKDSYSQIINKYNQVMSTEKIDKLLTTAFLSQGLKPISLSISSVGDATVSTTNTDDAAKTAETTTNNGMKQATANVTVNGTMTQVTNVIHYLNNLKGIEISKLNYADGSNGASSNMTMTIVVYMVNK